MSDNISLVNVDDLIQSSADEDTSVKEEKGEKEKGEVSNNEVQIVAVINHKKSDMISDKASICVPSLSKDDFDLQSAADRISHVLFSSALWVSEHSCVSCKVCGELLH